MSQMIPNSTQVPDVILDHWMAALSGAEFKIVLYVVRRTYGFRRASNDISLAQMAAGIVTRDGRRLDSGTGLNKDTVTKAVATLIDKGILLRARHTDERGRDLPSTYSINLATGFGREGQNILPGVGKSDPTSSAPGKLDTGESENPIPLSEKSVPYGSENPTGEEGENPTHNRQGLDIQSNTQLDIQKTTIPVPEATAAVVARMNKYDGDGAETRTLSLVTSIVCSAAKAKSIIREIGEETSRKTALWWPSSTCPATAKDLGAVFRVARRERYADQGVPGAAKTERDGERASSRRYVPARKAQAQEAKPDAADLDAWAVVRSPAIPPPAPQRLVPAARPTFDAQAVYTSLSETERVELDEAAWAKAMTDAPVFMRSPLEKASKSQEPPSRMVRDLLLIARDALIANREAEAARRRQIDVNFG